MINLKDFFIIMLYVDNKTFFMYMAIKSKKKYLYILKNRPRLRQKFILALKTKM